SESVMGFIVAVREPAGQSVRPMTMTAGTGSTALRRLVASLTALLAVTTAFAVGYVVALYRRGEPSSYRLTAAGLDSGLSCDRLLQWYVDHGLAQVTAWGWQSPIYREVAPSAVPRGPTHPRATTSCA